MALRDGTTVHVRPVRADDEDALHAFLEGLDPASRVFRFFSGGVDLRAAARSMADVDYAQRYGLVAIRDGDVIGQGIYIDEGGGDAEVAFAVADRLQGHGLATLLLAHLAEVAVDNGIFVFHAEVMPENHRMMEVFRESGFPVEISSEPGAIRVVFPTSFEDEAVRRFEDRDRLAAEAALRFFLEPTAIAVIGASRDRNTVGGQLFHNTLESGFEGVSYPVNPHADVVQSVHSYGSVAELPEDVELAVIVVPALAVVDAARECAARGVRALIVISAGFTEVGAEGAERERELVAVCREAGMRLIGPNCLGILNTTEGHSFNATFAPGGPPPGNVGFVTQSGALGLALIDLASDRSLGVSSFASIGNRADITANDMLEYWESDDATEVALLYIESFSDPRRFSRIARRVGRDMPIVAVKSGRSAAGQRATSSHTGRPDRGLGSHRRRPLRSGRGDPHRDPLRAARCRLPARHPAAAGGQPRRDRHQRRRARRDVRGRLRGRRAGGAAAARGGPLVPARVPARRGRPVEPSRHDRHRLRRPLPRRRSAALAAHEGLDALIVIFIKPLLTRPEDVAGAIHEAVAEMPRRIPVQAVFMSEKDHAAARAVGRDARASVSRGRRPRPRRGDATRRLAPHAARGPAGVRRRRRRGSRSADRRDARRRSGVDGHRGRLAAARLLRDPDPDAGDRPRTRRRRPRRRRSSADPWL